MLLWKDVEPLRSRFLEEAGSLAVLDILTCPTCPSCSWRFLDLHQHEEAAAANSYRHRVACCHAFPTTIDPPQIGGFPYIASCQAFGYSKENITQVNFCDTLEDTPNKNRRVLLSIIVMWHRGSSGVFLPSHPGVSTWQGRIQAKPHKHHVIKPEINFKILVNGTYLLL